MKPCKHEQYVESCRRCHLYANDARYRALWDDKNRQVGKPMPPATPARAVDKTPCQHLGAATGETVKCPSCRGSVELKLFACEVHGQCTQGRAVPGVASCVNCPDRTVSRPTWSMLLTGGIGDVFALESHLTPEERETLESVYYACPSADEIVRLMQFLERTQHYPRLRNHIVLPTGKTTCYSAGEVKRHVPDLPSTLTDFSIGKIFPQRRRYTDSTWLGHRLTDAPALPHSARSCVVVVPGSDWGYSPGRSFDDADWENCLKTLEAHDLYGIVLRALPHPTPKHPRLIDWQGKTNIFESIEVLKVVSGYLGIDSCLSVLAAKLFPAHRLAVKSVRNHLDANKSVYYAPRTQFDFVSRQLRRPSWE